MTALTKATLKDSNAMKNIAVLTTIFLPGTYIAVCFRIPQSEIEKLSCFVANAEGVCFYIVTVQHGNVRLLGRGWHADIEIFLAVCSV
jgi:hypothetical protein